MDYTHFNAVKHGVVKDAADWPYSSFHRHAAAGLYPSGWTSTADPPDTGERP